MANTLLFFHIIAKKQGLMALIQPSWADHKVEEHEDDSSTFFYDKSTFFLLKASSTARQATDLGITVKIFKAPRSYQNNFKPHIHKTVRTISLNQPLALQSTG